MSFVIFLESQEKIDLSYWDHLMFDFRKEIIIPKITGKMLEGRVKICNRYLPLP